MLAGGSFPNLLLPSFLDLGQGGESTLLLTP
jgi:hypothetical protein